MILQNVWLSHLYLLYRPTCQKYFVEDHQRLSTFLERLSCQAGRSRELDGEIQKRRQWRRQLVDIFFIYHPYCIFLSLNEHYYFHRLPR